MTSDRSAFHAILRQDLFSFIRQTFRTVAPGKDFIPNWHIEAIADALTRCCLGEITRLIITVPPRYLKSISASVAFPAWLLGQDPTLRIICASYNVDLAIKHALDTRLVLESPWYRETFVRTRLDPKKLTQTELTTFKRGSRLATSVGGTLTGRGGDFVIIDDAHKADEALSETKRVAVWDWFRTSLVSRLDSKQSGRIIVIQQRLHEEDLVGHLLETGGWNHLNLPAIAEADEQVSLGHGRMHIRRHGDPLDAIREPIEVLEKIKAAMGSHAFAAQYQQRPTPLGGGILKREWFPRYRSQPEIGTYTRVVQSWDTAIKAGEANDPSVCLTFVEVDGAYHLLDAFRARLEYPDLRREVISRARRFQAASVLVEDAGSGTSLLQDLWHEENLALIPRKPEGEKTIRAMAASGLIEAGRIHLPEEAPWLADFEHEIVNFPNGRHDDQVDALSQFVNWLRERPPVEFVCEAFPSRLYTDPMSPWYGQEEGRPYDGALT